MKLDSKNRAISQRIGYKWIYKRLMEGDGRNWQEVKQMSFFSAAKMLSIENAMT
jgi:hypothetical protein